MSLNPSPSNPPLRLLGAFQHSYPENSPDWIARAPGRDMWIAAYPTGDGHFRISVPDLEAQTHFDRRSARSKQTVARRPLPGWARYLAGVVVMLSDQGMDFPGMCAVILGEEPSGPRYEYTLALALSALWHDYNHRAYTADSLLGLVEQVRRDFVEG